jgi:phosphoribosyl 1,2-cyclic phosphodiesterase
MPVPGALTARYGGNTPCIEVRCGRHLLLFDAGTGLRPFAEDLLNRKEIINADIFLSHCHIDHIMGLPFFLPSLTAKDRVRLWAGNLFPQFTLSSTLNKLMSPPLFPIGVEHSSAKVDFADFKGGETISLAGGITLQTMPINHPDGAVAYRLNFAEKALAYVTDVELGPGPASADLIDFVRDADLLVIDATYTDDEIEAHRGWGHSTWQEVVALAEAAGVRRLCLFHHDPGRDDLSLDEIAAKAKAAFPDLIVAAEGVEIEL